MEGGLRFFLGFFSGMTLEVSFLALTLLKFCGPLYMINLLATFFAYVKFTREVGLRRVPLLREKRDFEKEQELYNVEILSNIESVKAFSNENLEKKRYNNLLDRVRDRGVEVQTTLTQLNIGQELIFNIGICLNLTLAAF